MEDLEAYLNDQLLHMSPDKEKTIPTPSQVPTGPAHTTAKPKTVSSNTSLASNERHGLVRCPVFNGYDVDWRNQLARDKRLCLNRFSCRTCGARHHTLLHKERPKMEIPQKAVVTSSPPTPNEADTPQVVPYSLHSIAVGIENNDSVAKARVIIDRGASTSLMTEALTTTLRLKRHPQSLLLGGHFGEQRSNQCIVATLQSLQNQSLTQERNG